MLLSWARRWGWSVGRMAHGGWPGRMVLHVRQHSAAWCFSRAGDGDQAWRGCCLCGARGAVARRASQPEAAQRETRAHDASHLMGWAGWPGIRHGQKSRVSDAVGADETAPPMAAPQQRRRPHCATLCLDMRTPPANQAAGPWARHSQARSGVDAPGALLAAVYSLVAALPIFWKSSGGQPRPCHPVTARSNFCKSATGPMDHSRRRAWPMDDGAWGFGGD